MDLLSWICLGVAYILLLALGYRAVAGGWSSTWMAALLWLLAATCFLMVAMSGATSITPVVYTGWTNATNSTGILYTVYDDTGQIREIYGVELPEPGIWGVWHYGLAMISFLMCVLSVLETAGRTVTGSRKQ